MTYIDQWHWHYLEIVAEFINLLLHEEYSVLTGPVRTVLLQVDVIDVSIPSYVDSILGQWRIGSKLEAQVIKLPIQHLLEAS